ncbi:Inactive N-acetylated-alpha-linked acidic dipeptidase-like protein 2 [Labeo rohita]|uniref:Inactive N-acetylated-alpha-linked acidic dipeptidase-like protein 2 n=1 Tax=Labeo rohita TaxID=84645 RepID=A0ABQ8M911_LABRO|nr:Inactive N-acetylated-alpha-linked acidic dipeptidase-like protein 2 [Labeo rohita]
MVYAFSATHKRMVKAKDICSLFYGSCTINGSWICQCLTSLTNSFGFSVCSSARKIINLTIENQASFKTVHNVIGYLKGKTNPDRYVLVGSRHGSWYEGALADWGNGSAVMTQIIASMTAQTRAGWQPDRTIVFCSWGGTSLGNIGSFEWGKENAVVLQSRAVAYVSLHSPVRAPGSLQATVSPSLQQLAAETQKVLLKHAVGQRP